MVKRWGFSSELDGVGEDGLLEALQRKGISRREFLKFCAVIGAALAVPVGEVGRIAEVLASEGWGWTEAPRGALGHRVRIKDGQIENYQCIVPTTWNASPRDANGQPGAYEASLVGTQVADPDKPLEILRTIHSFDPCIACAVHLVEPRGKTRILRVG